MRSGRLWRRAGTGNRSRRQRRREAMALISAARAPQARTATDGSIRVGPREPRGGFLKEMRPGISRSAIARKGQLVDEQVVEVGSAGELDVLDLVQDGRGLRPLAQAERGD